MNDDNITNQYNYGSSGNDNSDVCDANDAVCDTHQDSCWHKTRHNLYDAPQISKSDVNAFGAPLLGDSRDLFRPASQDIPAKPGVYKWRDGQGRVIYVGKAKNLRNRLANYFQPLYQLHPRTQSMVLTARSLEWTVVATEFEALTLEYTWIKAFDPRFNVVFRDDKTYPYVAVSVGEEFPRVWITRNRGAKKTLYFGPYAKVWPLRHSLDSLLKTFPVRTCSSGVFYKAHRTGRPCLLASIGKCSAPCVGNITPREHREYVEHVVGILTGSIGNSYIAQITCEMKRASEDLEFERAAALRDEIAVLSTVLQQNAVVFDDDVEADVFGLCGDDLEASIHAFFVRAGMIRGERNWSVERNEEMSDGELLADLLTHVYAEYEHDATEIQRNLVTIKQLRDAFNTSTKATAIDPASRAQATKIRRERQETTGREDLLAPIAPVPREIIVPVAIPEERLQELESWLSSIRGSQVTIRVAERGEKRALMQRANDNASQALTRIKSHRISSMEMRTEAMNEIAQALGMAEAPLRIECYDISNTVDGSYQVASMVVFEDGLARPSEYRHFAIRGENGDGKIDDLSAVYETILRRFSHSDAASNTASHNANKSCENNSYEDMSKKRFAYRPQLVMVDGGREQAKAARRAMHDAGIYDITVCGLAKKLEEVWLPDEDYPIILKRSSQGLYLLQRARDESHRFAITYHRIRRRKGALHSILDTIPGIGVVYRKRLLAQFGSVKGIRKASLEDLQKVPGIGESKAKIIYTALRNSND